jgi:hypothetical protein
MVADNRLPAVDEAQLLYARILKWGVYIGLLVLLLTFGLYLSGLVAPSVPLAELPKYWGLSVHDYLRATNEAYLHHPHAITGWAWLSVLGTGDYLCFLGIAFLSGVTIACYVAITPGLLRRKEVAYAGMAILESAILALAASGVLTVGH